MIVNDPRAFHREQKSPHMNQEMTLAIALTINPDIIATETSYGSALCTELIERRDHHGEKLKVVELGPGNGFPSLDFLVCLSEGYRTPFDYKAIDAAPNLLKFNAVRYYELLGNCSTDFVLGDAHDLTGLVEPGSVDILIANEMVGDLLTLDEIPREVLEGITEVAPEGQQHVNELRRIIERYGIGVNPTGRLAYNLGAFQVLEQAKEVLAPGGMVFISEHSSEKPLVRYDLMRAALTREVYIKHTELVEPTETVPTPVPLGTGRDAHTEYTTRFSDLITLGHALGFEMESGAVVDFLDVKRDTRSLKHDLVKEAISSRRFTEQRFLQELQLTSLVPPAVAASYDTAFIYVTEHPHLLDKVLGAKDKLLRDPPFQFGNTAPLTVERHGQFEYILAKKA